MKTLIIIPCYNEAKRLETDVFLDFAKKHPDIHFLFVNDGSKDDTRAVIDAMAREMPMNIRTHHMEKNKGKAEAVREGFLKGFTLSPELIGFLDADLASPITTVLELETALSLGRKDIAIASRVKLLGRAIERNPVRHYVGRVFATAASLILNLPVYDTQCGAKLFRVNDRLKAVFNKPFTVKWIFDVEILGRLIITEKDGQPPVKDICVEYPIHTWVDKKGSKIRPMDFVTSTGDLFKVWWLMRKRTW
jgi:glycosyltransferase involved in cell wall biosynthesis